MANETEEQTGNVLNSSARYEHSPEWADLEPIYNSAEEDAVVRINHTPELIDAFAFFRAILHKNEVSERAFELTTTCTQLNPANYSVWQYRRNLLRSLNKSIDDEFKFCEEMACENPKNYQIWHHRRVLVEWSSDPSRELRFTEDILDGDPKNYHAWQHRQWVVEKFNLFDQLELDCSTRLIEEDVRNNSAWNYRHFVAKRLSRNFGDKEFVDREVKFTLDHIRSVSNNESAWSYLLGLFPSEGLEARPDLLTFCQALHTERPSPQLCYVLFDFRLAQLERGVDAEENAKKCLAHIEELRRTDSVRNNYLDYLQKRVLNLLAYQ